MRSRKLALRSSVCTLIPRPPPKKLPKNSHDVEQAGAVAFGQEPVWRVRPKGRDLDHQERSAEVPYLSYPAVVYWLVVCYASAPLRKKVYPGNYGTPQ